MTDYIERQIVENFLQIFLNGIKNAPTADVQPNMRGKWINQRADSEMCSACGARFYISALFAVGGNDEPNFCPNCGAKMMECVSPEH